MLERYNTILQTQDFLIFMCIITYFLHVLKFRCLYFAFTLNSYLRSHLDFSRVSIFLTL